MQGPSRHDGVRAFRKPRLTMAWRWTGNPGIRDADARSGERRGRCPPL